MKFRVFQKKILNSDWEGIFQVNNARFWRQKNGQLIGLAISAGELEFVHQALRAYDFFLVLQTLL